MVGQGPGATGCGKCSHAGTNDWRLIIAKFNQKSEADIAWDKIRREVTYRVNLAAANWKADVLNRILPTLQDKFEDSLTKGTILELQSGTEAETFVQSIEEYVAAHAR